MHQLSYLPLSSATQAIFITLVEQLYAEDPMGKPISLEKNHRTIETLRTKPDLGEILLLQHEGEIIGYSILINFWSNEFGGNVLTIDELYIQPSHRGQGIASEFIKRLKAERYNDAVALQLEVTPENSRAQQLYQRLGFEPMENQALIAEII